MSRLRKQKAAVTDREKNARPVGAAKDREGSGWNGCLSRRRIRQGAHQIRSPIWFSLTRNIFCVAAARAAKATFISKSSRNRAPRQYTEGEEGERGNFLLELRTIADAGLVGYPNAGKSTLLRKISAARPKVAPYPFTTLHPIVGVVELDAYRRATIADIPGLIEGAHRNVGLGHDFLRHITRCKILLFVVDAAGSEGRHPIEDLQNLRREIDLFDPRLSQRPWYIIANKMDLPDAAQNFAEMRERFPEVEAVAVSAATGEGIDRLKVRLGIWLDRDENDKTVGENTSPE